MQTIIDKAINQINQGAEWVLNNVKVNKIESYKNLVKERRTLKRILSACSDNTSVVLYGQSQCGKSHMASSLLSDDGKPMLVVDRINNKTYEFLTRLNPKGKKEATGLITRFTTREQSDITSQYPVHVRLMSVKDIVLMLCDGYYRDLRNRKPFDRDEIRNTLEQLRRQTGATKQRYITEDDMGYIEEYFCSGLSNISQDSYYTLSSNDTDYFSELSLIIEKLNNEDIIRALCLLWNNNQNYSDVFRRLFNACMQLDFATDAYISFAELDNANKTLLHVDWLDLDDTTVRSQVRHKRQNGEFCTTSVDKTLLAAICAEVILEIKPPTGDNQKSQYIRTILQHVDILDFPGARSRGRGLDSGGQMGQLLRRGKVGYYFNKYSIERRISSLIFCWEPNNFEATPMDNVIRNWVDVAIGSDASERAKYMENLEVPPLFFVGTKYNVHLAADTDDREGNINGLISRWNGWFNEQLSRDIIGVPSGQEQENDNYKWFESWTTKDPDFGNIYLLRDFRYSTTIFDGWTESGGVEGHRKPGPYNDYFEKLRESFINHPFVRRHIKDAESRWDEASEPNCDGSLPIARNMASIVEKLASAAMNKNMRDYKMSIEKVIAVLESHHYSTDTEINLKKALDSAARLQASLDFAFGRDPYYFGRFMKSITITEYAVHEVFSEVFTRVYQAGNVGDYVYIYMRVPELSPSNTFEENLEKLRSAYGFMNEEDCRHYFENTLKINLKELFERSKFGLQSPSRMLASTLKTYLFSQWLGKDQRNHLCDILGEGPYKELIDMLQSLFDKYDLERLIAQTIHNYVDTFGVDVKELSEMIADICAEMVNKFVLSVGYDYYSEKEGVVDSLKEAMTQHGIELNFRFVDDNKKKADNGHIANLMAQMDDMERTRQLLMHPNDHSIDEISTVIPGFRESCRWRDLSKVGYVLTNDIPTYDVEANERLGQIIDNCKTLNQ